MTEGIAAIILAAGYSSRMGQFKPLLPLGEQTALEKTVEMFRTANIPDIRVIAGYRAEELAPLLERLGVAWTFNERYREGMFTSVQCAVARLPANTRAFLLQPVDMPLTRQQTLSTLLETGRTSGKGIIHPVFWGKRGHPPLISTRYRRLIMESSGEGGLKALLLPYLEDILELELPDEHIVLDMDTPEDYAYLQHRQAHYATPSPRECEHLLAHEFDVPQPVLEHSRAVANVTAVLVEQLAGRDFRADGELLQAAALLHDCARTQRRHAAAGEAALRRLGFPEVAAIVGQHMDLTDPDGPGLTPAEILYLADKLVAGTRLVNVEERFAAKLARFADQPEVLQAVKRRLDRARGIQHKIENITGRPLAALLADLPRNP